MPPVLIGIGVGALAGAIGATAFTIAGSAILGGAVLFGGLAAIQYLLTPSPPSLPDLNFDYSGAIGQTTQGAVVPVRWVLGRARTAGVMVRISESGDRLYMVQLISAGPISGIERMWAGGEEVEFTRTDNRLDGAGDWENRISVWEYFAADGDGGLEGPRYRGRERADLRSDDRFQDISYVTIQLDQPDYGTNLDDRFWQTIPQMSFQVRGLKFTWPGQDEPAWTDNAAAIRYWWLRNRRGIPDEAIDIPSVIEALRVCGEMIPVHRTTPDTEAYEPAEPRYAINGVVISGQDVAPVEAEMDWAWQGNVIELDGVHHFRPGVERAPVLTITSDDILGTESVRPAPALQDRANVAHLELAQSAQHDWTALAIPEFVDEAALARDGERYPIDLGQRIFVASASAATRLLATYMRRARASAVVVYRMSPRADLRWLTAIPTDRVVVTDPALGLANWQAVIHGITVNPDWSVTVQLEESPDGIYQDDIVLPPALAPRPTLAATSREPPPAPTITRAEAEVSLGPDGAAISRIIVEVAPSPYVLEVDVGDHHVGLATSAARVIADVAAPGEYEIRARFITRQGVTGASASASVEVSWESLRPDPPRLLQVRAVGAAAQLVIAADQRRDIAGIDLAFTRAGLESSTPLPGISDSGWADAARLDAVSVIPSIGDRPLIANVLIPRPGRYRLAARAITRAGLESLTADFGTHLFSPPLNPADTYQAHPAWLGELRDMAVVPGPRAALAYDPPMRTIPRRAWNGADGWPFGRSGSGSGYTTEAIPLHAMRSVRAMIEARILTPAGGSIPATPADFISYALEASADQVSWVARATAPDQWTELPPARYIRARVDLPFGWQGRGFTGLAVHYREST